MTTMHAEDVQTREMVLETWPVNITSYRLAGEYRCVVDNVSPGAAIARGEGPTREIAENEAIGIAAKRLGSTRRVKAYLDDAMAAATKAAELFKK